LHDVVPYLSLIIDVCKKAKKDVIPKESFFASSEILDYKTAAAIGASDQSGFWRFHPDSASVHYNTGA